MENVATLGAGLLPHPKVDTAYPPVRNGKLAMWLFLASEVIFFTVLIGSYIVLRFGYNGAWPNLNPETGHHRLNIPLTALNTFILICSSYTMVKALLNMQKGRQALGARFLMATALIGMVFLSVQAYEYHHLWGENVRPSVDVFCFTFYIMTCFHGMHVFGGVVTLWVITIGAFRNKVTQRNAGVVENVGLYWHFVDLVWIILFTVVYLI